MKRIFSLIIIIIINISIITGCSSSQNSYESLTVENELCSYSISYPSTYEKEFLDNLEFKVPYVYLALHGPMIEQVADVFNPDEGLKTVVGHRRGSWIHISVSNSKKYFGENFTYVDRLEKLLSAEARWKNYKLLNRSPITVSGVQGEFVEYLVDMLMPIPREDGKNLEYNCLVYFDYNGLLWEIDAACVEYLRDQLKADFEYVIQTFKIIR